MFKFELILVGQKFYKQKLCSIRGIHVVWAFIIPQGILNQPSIQIQKDCEHFF